MCSAPQQLTSFEHLNSKCDPNMFLLPCWLRNMLRATIPHLNCPKCSWCEMFFFIIFTSKSVSHHNGVHFWNISTSKNAPNPSALDTFDFEKCHDGAQLFISHLARWLCPPLWRVYFSTLRNQKTLEKHSASRLFLPLRAPTFSFFFLLLFSDSSYLCFSICQYCQKWDFQTSFG